MSVCALLGNVVQLVHACVLLVRRLNQAQDELVVFFVDMRVGSHLVLKELLGRYLFAVQGADHVYEHVEGDANLVHLADHKPAPVLALVVQALLAALRRNGSLVRDHVLETHFCLN